ncbi:MAG: hypothetical protein B6243_09170 [Anaerolineaceae bacterium 4572_5.2]|nr:MAG: hypothetical protein B6243_09170 [Anaerolineaceae bacterium 4572_5.2]
MAISFPLQQEVHLLIRLFAHSLFPLELYWFVREKQLIWGDVMEKIMAELYLPKKYAILIRR